MPRALSKNLLLSAGLALFLWACAPLWPTPEVEIVYVEVTSTHSSTPNPTPTFTPTPMPTPTALPIVVTGDIRAARLSTPSPKYGAQCGVVDLLDFPLNPPDAIATRGGGDFGVYRDRYSGYHTGEDWGIRGRSNFGEPVFSIGNGLVTHAHPNGWGEDKGTVVIQHAFPDGGKIYSFYGHLDPPSVKLVAGQCVSRGEKIGEIGRPRSSPHLHFEIRAIFPNEPTRGYVPYDPTLVGWKPPTMFILEHRLRTSPGLMWMRSSPNGYSRDVGVLGDHTLLIQEEDNLTAIDLSDGSTRWSEPLSQSAIELVLDSVESQIYFLSGGGELTAYELADFMMAGNRNEPNVVELWSRRIEPRRDSQLIPLPGGGVAVTTEQELLALSSEGAKLWREESLREITRWSESNHRIYLSSEIDSPALWEIADTRPLRTLAPIPGKALNLNPKVLIYSRDGLFELDLESGTSDLLISLPQAFPDLGSMLETADGGVLIAHSDVFDRRLIALGPDGDLRWERSYAQAGSGPGELFMFDSGPLLMVGIADSRFGSLSLLSLDVVTAVLTPIFEAGPVSSFPSATWAREIDGHRLILNLGGHWTLMIDTQIALDAVSDPAEN